MAKDKYFIIRANDRFKERVNALAALEGVSVSEYVTDMLKKKVWEAEMAGLLPRSMDVERFNSGEDFE